MPCSSIKWKKRLNFAASHFITSWKLVTSGCSVKNKPNIPPTYCTTNGTLCLAANAFKPSANVLVFSANFSSLPALESSVKHAKPAAIAIGLPESVPAW